MTETSTDIEAASKTLSPSATLMNLIVALLAPMFLGVTGGDPRYARLAAVETINAYRAHNQAGLIAVAQIIAFGLAALGSLSLSLADDISLSMTLRLRANANACNRSAEQNRRALAASQATNPTPHPNAAPESPAASPDDHATPFLSAAAAEHLTAASEARLLAPEPAASHAPVPAPPGTPEKRHQEMWAIAMIKESSQITASIPNLPPAERSAAAVQAATLSSTAHDLLYGSNATPPVTITLPDRGLT